MESTATDFSFKPVLTTWPRGEPRTTADLGSRGMSPYRASALARSGWLEHVARGVYKLPGDTLDRDACLALLARELPGLHVGGRTALDWRGVRHSVAARELLVLWGERPARLPAWFIQRFPSTYRATRLFDSTLPAGTGLQALPNGRTDVLVSTPERALLELLSDVGKGQTLAEARLIVEGLAGLRPKVLDQLLSHTTRVKVVRLAHAMAAATGHLWAEVTAAQNRRLGGGGWVAVTKAGERIDLRRT
jgi:hypothetical protein